MDPRTDDVRNLRDTRSPLMKALSKSAEPPNFCPFGCETHDLDGVGFCHHLVGFTNGGGFYEPRLVSKQTGRVHTVGAKKRQMQPGFVMVRITTSARVYSQEGDNALRGGGQRPDRETVVIAERERELLALAESIRTPRLDGLWSPSSYDLPAATSAA